MDVPPTTTTTTRPTRAERKRRHQQQQQQTAADVEAPRKLKRSQFLPVDASSHAAPWTWRGVLEYDGTAFHGFQAQEQRATTRTVQEVVEDAIARTTGERVRVRGASRTDRGVHARGQVIAFASRCEVAAPERFREALNTRLPEDVVCRRLQRLTRAEKTPTRAETDAGEGASFDPRANALGKIYEYTIVAGGLRPALERQRAWFIKKPLDLALMRQAAAFLVAEPAAKDFSAFTPPKSSEGNEEKGKGNVCTLTQVEIVERPGPYAADDDETQAPEAATWIRIRFHGDRFLYKMVRNLVGTLVDVGLGRIAPEQLPVILETKDRAKAGQGAPAHGLTLVKILYKDNDELERSTGQVIE